VKRRHLSSIFVVVTGLVLLHAGTASAFTYDFGPFTSPNGSDQTVYDWDWDTMAGTGNSCAQPHTSDGSPKPIRDSQGRIQIVMQGEENRRLMGTSFSDLKPEQLWIGTFPDARPCATNGTHPQGSPVPPDQYHTYDWLTTPYRTLSPSTIHTLVHLEYHGSLSPGPGCDSEKNGNDAAVCWLGSTTYSKSTDDGATSVHDPAPPGHYAFSVPYQYTKDWGRHGLATTGGLINSPYDDHFYTITNAENSIGVTNKHKGRNLLQKDGNCVLRSPSLPGLGQWTGFADYTGFSATFPKPYPTEPADKTAHVCESVTDHLTRHGNHDAFIPALFTARGLAYDAYLERFILIGNVPGGQAAYYSLSPDMINWSEKQLLLQPNTSGSNCGAGMGYPNIADQSDTSASFERPGRTPDLFYVCGGPSDMFGDANVVRVPFKFGYRSATFEDASIVHPTTGFDSVEGSSGLSLSTTQKYEGTRSVNATYQGAALPRGTFDVNWKTGKNAPLPSGKANADGDVWYSGAFRLPSGFASANTGTALMRWENQAGDQTGGVVFQPDDSVAVQRGSTPIDGGRFYLPENKWFWLEVHQRLHEDRPLSEVFVDGQLVWTSNAPNAYVGGEVKRVRFGFAAGSPATGSSLHLDRATISESQRGAYGVPGGTQVPPAPTQWSVKGQGGSNLLRWQPVPGATAYRVYRRAPTSAAPNVTWQLLSDTSALTLTDSGLTSSQPYQYRITAYNSAGDSIVSAPKQAIPGGRMRVTVNVVGASNNDYTTLNTADGAEITDPQDFQFLASSSAFGSSFFTLDDDPTSSTPGSIRSAWVTPGSNYWAGMILPPGWQQVSNGCDNGSNAINVTIHPAEELADDVNCWFVVKRTP
jgi:hypothetical protein